MAWSTKTGVNLRSSVAYVTDPAGTVALAGYNNATGNSSNIDPYSGTGANSPLTVNGNTFSIGWVKTSDKSYIGSTIDGARNRSTTVDARLAGAQTSFTATAATLQIQLGNSPGQYKIWMGIGSQGVGTGSAATSVPVYDATTSAGSPLFTITLPSSITANQFIDAAGNSYTSAANWAAAAEGSGLGVTFSTTDTSNGNGGPLLFIDCGSSAGNCPVAHIAFQFLGASQTGQFDCVLP